MKRIRIIEILMFSFMLILMIGCESKKDCPACNGVGFFMDNSSGAIVDCVICEKGKVSADEYESLTNTPDIDTKPIDVNTYCSICMGTGIFKAPNSVFQSKCSICKGKGVADDERYNTTAALYVCVDCGGSGKNAYDGSICSSCYGNGTTYVSVTDQLNSNPRSQSGTLCGACGGSGVCPVCKGHNGHRYGDIRYCSTCGNTGLCHWCHGQGISYR